jgi:membrane-associated phospholipid phosphatase
LCAVRRPPPVVLLLAAALATAPAPARADPRPVYDVSPALDGAIIGLAALGNVVPIVLTDRLIQPRCPCDRSEVPRFERFAIDRRSDGADLASDVTLVLALTVPPLAGLAALGPSRALAQDLTVFGEAIAVSGALVTLAKYTVQRPTPRAYAGDPASVDDADAYRAFFSGHTALTFTALTAAAWTLRLRHGELVWPWFVAGAVGASVAAERVLAGHHFPTDVVAGAAVGIGVGILVPLLHERGGGRPALGVAPSVRGISIAGRF